MHNAFPMFSQVGDYSGMETLSTYPGPGLAKLELIQPPEAILESPGRNGLDLKRGLNGDLLDVLEAAHVLTLPRAILSRQSI